MRYNSPAAMVALSSILFCSAILAQDEAHAARAIREATMLEGPLGLMPANAMIGQNLEDSVSVKLTGPAPDLPLRLTVKTDDPKKLMLAAAADSPAVESLELTVPAGFRRSPDFFLRGLASSGTATYTATAAGYPTAKGTVTLAPSGVLIGGPGKLGATRFRTTTGRPIQVVVYSALLDADKNVVSLQAVANSPVKVNVSSSNPEAGKTESAQAVIAPGASSAILEFKPKGAGDTTLSVDVPAGFTTPAQFTTIAAVVLAPGFGISGDIGVGYNLETNATVTLGQPAPAGGLTITMTSNDPSKLLLSNKAEDPGSKSITVKIPADGILGTYFLQSLGDSGEATYTATAPGYTTRTATIALRPSGIALAPPGGLDGPRGFVARLSGQPQQLSLWMAQLDPVYHTSTDQTTQRLRGGLTLTVKVTDSNPEIGKTTPAVVFKGGQETLDVQFTPLSEGAEVISVVTPEGMTASRNHSTLKMIVTK